MADMNSARLELREWIEDMEKLSRLADGANPEHQPFVDAFRAAREGALAAAQAYADAAKKG